MNCNYCETDSIKRRSLMDEICVLDFSTVYLFKDQTYPGRVVVAFNKHKEELFEFTEQELLGFWTDVSIVAKILSQLFCADKINYSVWGDNVRHYHVHVVPKKKDLPCWGEPFLNKPSHPGFVPEQVFQDRKEIIKKELLNFKKGLQDIKI